MKYKVGDICCLEKGKQIDTSLLSEQNPYKYINGGTTESGYYIDYNTSGFTITVSEGGASCGFVNYIDEPFWCGCHCYRLTDIKFPPKYVYYALKANQKKIMTLRTGTAMPNIKKSIFSQFEITLSENNEEQEKITNILDKVTVLIEQRQQQLETLDTLVKSRFIEMFGDPVSNPLKWPVKRLADISLLITNGNTPKGGSDNYVSKGIMFLRSQNVWRNRIELDDVAYIDMATHESMKKSSVHDKDILITKTGRINTENSSLGRAALFHGANDSANINGHVYLVRLDGTMIPEYVVAILTGEPYRRYIRKVCVGGIDKRQINLDQVEDFPIIMPPKTMQEQFAAFVQATDKSKLAIKKSIDELQTLFDSLMQEYFG